MIAPFEIVCPSPGPYAAHTVRERWLEARRSLVTASDAGAILGLTDWRSPFAVWCSKQPRFEEPDRDVPEYLTIGLELEDALATMFMRRTGALVLSGPLSRNLIRSTRYPHLGCTVDFELAAPDPNKMPELCAAIGVETYGKGVALGPGVLEIKTSGGGTSGSWDEAAPDHHRAQVDAQLAVSGREWGAICVLLGGRGFRFRWAAWRRSEDRERHLVDVTRGFHERYMLGDERPDPDGQDLDLVKALFPTAGDFEIDLGDDALAWHTALDHAKAAERAAKKARKDAEAKLRLALGNAKAGVLPDGSGSYSLKKTSRGGFIVAPTSYRTLRFQKPKEGPVA